jgi:hypothetical protein
MHKIQTYFFLFTIFFTHLQEKLTQKKSEGNSNCPENDKRM